MNQNSWARPGAIVGEARINHLATSDNKRGKPLIKVVDKSKKEKPVEKPVEKPAPVENPKTYHPFSPLTAADSLEPTTTSSPSGRVA